MQTPNGTPHILNIQNFISGRGFAPIDISDGLTCAKELNLEAFRLFADMSKHLNMQIYFTSGAGAATITRFTRAERRPQQNVVHVAALALIRKKCKTATCGPKMHGEILHTISTICAFKSVHFVPSFSFEHIGPGIRLIVHITQMTASDIETIIFNVHELTFSQGYLKCDFYEQRKRTRTRSPTDSNAKYEHEATPKRRRS